MNEPITLFGTVPTTAASSPTTPTVELFDPPMCCPTGLCGPSLDQTLLDVSEMVETLTAEGIPVERYQMTSHPHRFMNNAEVMRLVREKQMEALPITLISGRVLKVGAYPTGEEVRVALREK